MYGVSVEFDWKVLMSVLALAISIYTWLENKRLRSVEKKTIVLNELLEAKLFLMKITDMLYKLEETESLKNKSNHFDIIKSKNETEGMNNKLDEFINKMLDMKNYNLNDLEELRTFINIVTLEAKYIYEKYQKEI